MIGVVAVVYKSTAFCISRVLYYSQHTFLSNYGSISCRLWDIQCRKMWCPWNRGQRTLKVIETFIIP